MASSGAAQIEADAGGTLKLKGTDTPDYATIQGILIGKPESSLVELVLIFAHRCCHRLDVGFRTRQYSLHGRLPNKLIGVAARPRSRWISLRAGQGRYAVRCRCYGDD